MIYCHVTLLDLPRAPASCYMLKSLSPLLFSTYRLRKRFQRYIELTAYVHWKRKTYVMVKEVNNETTYIMNITSIDQIMGMMMMQ